MMTVNKLHDAIRYFSPRLADAVRVYREDPDTVITLSETEDGRVEFTHGFGHGVAQNHRIALEGMGQMYLVMEGQPGSHRREDGGSDD